MKGAHTVDHNTRKMVVGSRMAKTMRWWLEMTMSEVTAIVTWVWYKLMWWRLLSRSPPLDGVERTQMHLFEVASMDELWLMISR